MARTQKTDLPVGDGKGRVNATRGFSHWYSTRRAGITVKADVSVSLTCGQSEEEVKAAAAEASRIAETSAFQGIEEMDLYIDDFVKRAPEGGQ